jgi:spore coat protein A
MSREMSRREFLLMTAAVGVSTKLAGWAPLRPHSAVSKPAVPSGRFAYSPRVRKFVVGLPGLGLAGANEIGQYIPLATKSTRHFAGRRTDVYDLAVAEYRERMHPDLPGPTRFWGYRDAAAAEGMYLGGVIVAHRDRPVLLNVTNRLPNKQLIPSDPTIMAGGGKMVGDLPYNRCVTHLHGGFTPWFSDGTPFQWFAPSGLAGASFSNVPGTKMPTGSTNYYYPMQQSARLLWYHDHAIGITRTNAYSGLVSALVIVDDFELGLVNKGLLPDLIGTPLVIQDKTFVAEDILTQDPSWRWGEPGSLWYPHVYAPNDSTPHHPNPMGRWDWGPTMDPDPSHGTMPLPVLSAIPEAFFDTILVNGGLYPVAKVAAQRVRFRILNGAPARFFHLTLLGEDPANPGEAKRGAPGPAMYQVGTEGGFLPAVAVHDNRTKMRFSDPETVDPHGPFNLLLAPAERADVVIDFSGVAAGTSFILCNDAPAPFPGGDSRNDFFTGDESQVAEGGSPSTRAGRGPDTRTLLKITVGPGRGERQATDAWLKQLNGHLKANYLSGNQPPLIIHGSDPSVPKFPYTGPVTRRLTLNEDFDEYGRLIQHIGTLTSKSTNNQGIPTWGLPYEAPATETPAAGATEIWQIFNLTSDVHPMHFHLVNVQLLQRQGFAGDPTSYELDGRPIPPDPNEAGWKETVRCNPGEVTTVAMKFDLPKLPTSEMRRAVSPRTGGHEYVWHCHILEHEEHDMMRPLIVR